MRRICRFITWIAPMHGQPEGLYFTQTCHSRCLSVACSEDRGSAHRQTHPSGQEMTIQVNEPSIDLELANSLLSWELLTGLWSQVTYQAVGMEKREWLERQHHL